VEYRALLVRLVAAGTPPPEIIQRLISLGLLRGEIDMLLHDCGVQFAKTQNFNDGISDQRRLELQELSTSND
jgi:hypothetical protein